MTADARVSSAAALGKSRQIQLGNVADLADALLMARADHGNHVDPFGRAVFWVGAGTSVSAGIPSGRALAGRLAQWIAAKLGRVDTPADHDDQAAHELALAELQRAGKIGLGHTLGTAYGELFAKLGTNDQRDFIRRVIMHTNRRQINWSHLAIGELVRQRVVHTLLTTNFDDLLLDGLVRCDQLPAIIDGVESLNRMDPQPPVPQLVYLHGSQHTYSPRNSTEAVLGTRDLRQAQGGLYGLLQHCSVLVVVGYAGNSGEGVMELLQESCCALPELPIYWIAHGQQDSLSQAAGELLSMAKYGRLIPGQDADLFFRQLLREMRIGVPAWFRGPVSHLLHLANRIRVEPTPQSAELCDEVDDFCQRLRELEPLWDKVGAENIERRGLRQLMLSDNHAEVWARLRDRTLDDLALLQMRAEAAYELGRSEKGDTLERSVRDWSKVAARLSPGSAEWALAQDRLGDAQAALGERKHQERAVRNAIDAYELALTVHSREAMPLKWASTRNNQGLALLALVQLCGGTGSRQHLAEAEVAFGDALSVYRRDAMPTEWAAAQCDRALVLQMLGLPDDAVLLEKIVATYTEALQVQMRAQARSEWVMTACRRAVALMELGCLRHSERPVREASEELAGVLQAVARESQPSQWTIARHHYGAALLTLGQHGDEVALREGISILGEALTAHDANLGRVVDWTTLSGHIGGSLLRLAVGGDTEAIGEAIEVLNRARVLLDGGLPAAGQAPAVAELAQHVSDELVRVAKCRSDATPGLPVAASAQGTSADVCDAATRVLVVEDSEVDQDVLVGMLGQCINNLQLSLHGTGAKAVADLTLFQPHLLILDLNLPDMQGGEVLACARAINPSLPVLLYSGDPEAMSRLRTLAASGQSFAMLKKGCSLEELKRLLPTLFKRRQRDVAPDQLVSIGAAR
ncbi:MAG TPA: response regulator [Ideonella sp.]|nr:response regulator [Ideonella sp.]